MAEEKQTTRAKRESGHSGLFLELIFQSIRSFVEGTIESVHQAMHRLVRTVVRRASAFFLFLVGLVFVAVGFAKLLNAVYPIPGVGEATVGVFMLLLASVLYAFSREG